MGGEVAIDIGGTKTLVAVTAADGERRVLRLATGASDPPEAIVERIAGVVLSERTPGALGRVVVASPGSLDTAAGIVRYAANLPFRDFPLAQALADRIGGPVALVGDATAATVAEFASGAAAGVEHGAYVTVSTGIGIALVVDGRLATGAGRQGGELGHVPVRPHAGVRCACGQLGCLEAYASGRGLADRARDALAGGAASHLSEIAPERLTAREVVAAAGAGDRLAGGLVDQAVELLAVALSAVVRVLAPRALVLGGGLVLAGALIDPLRERVAALLEPNAGDVAQRLLAAAHGERSALEGAAALARGDAVATRLAGAAEGG